MGDTRTRARRADAARNTERIVEAARMVFRRQGPSAPYYTIATAAGVGQATLYRHFPNKEALVRAIVEENARSLEAASLSIHDDGGRFEEMLRVLAELIADNVEVGVLMNAEEDGEWYVGVIDRIVDLMYDTLTPAHPDLDRQDMRVLLAMLGSSVANAPAAERRQWSERALRLVLSGVGRQG